ncbi:unnamed protein product, partial [Vitis vinifera]
MITRGVMFGCRSACMQWGQYCYHGGGFLRKEGMERKSVMSKNVSTYQSQASALENHAAANCKGFAPLIS